jgi:Fe-S-cluster-containing hydrogenase component 2
MTMSMTVFTARCPQNHPCPMVPVCPVGAIQQDGVKAPTIDADKCIDCGKCVKGCPMRAFVPDD